MDSWINVTLIAFVIMASLTALFLGGVALGDTPDAEPTEDIDTTEPAWSQEPDAGGNPALHTNGYENNTTDDFD